MRTKLSPGSLIALATLGPALLLAACDVLRNVPEEVFYARYEFARPDRPRPDGVVYEVKTDTSGTCADTLMRLEDIARSVQSIGGTQGLEAMAHCFRLYTVGNTAPTLRENELIVFGADDYGTRGFTIYGNLTNVQGSSSNATNMTLTVSNNAQAGDRTSSGYAEIRFGNSGDLFRCEDGVYPWHTNIVDEASDTFFEVEVEDRTSDIIAGRFSCLARRYISTNTYDASDDRLLIVIEGRFVMRNEGP